jgi:hypothetical protein
MMDQVQIASEDTQRFLDAFENIFLPPAIRRGMELVACWHTPVDLGEDVTVSLIFQMRDWSHWNELRGKTVRDPALGDWLRELVAMRKGGTRQFYTGASCSPLR